MCGNSICTKPAKRLKANDIEDFLDGDADLDVAAMELHDADDEDNKTPKKPRRAGAGERKSDNVFSPNGAAASSGGAGDPGTSPPAAHILPDKPWEGQSVAIEKARLTWEETVMYIDNVMKTILNLAHETSVEYLREPDGSRSPNMELIPRLVSMFDLRGDCSELESRRSRLSGFSDERP